MTEAELEGLVLEIGGTDAGPAERARLRAALSAAAAPGPLPPAMARVAAATLARIAAHPRPWLDLGWPLALGALAWWQAPQLITLGAWLGGVGARLANLAPQPLAAASLALAAVITLGITDLAER